jgi:hypothetical protein
MNPQASEAMADAAPPLEVEYLQFEEVRKSPSG